MAYEIEKPIDYSATGDDIDAFAQKVKATQEQIFSILNELNTNGAQAGTDTTGKEPYSWIIDTSTNTIGMVDADGNFVEFGSVEAHLGLTAEKIGAIINRSNSFGRMMLGLDANKPTTDNETHDWYWAYDAAKIYHWTGSTWKVAFSLNFKDILNYEAYCVARSELGTSGAGKVLVLDDQGKANVDITGSPEMLLGFTIDTQDLQDDHVLVYDADKGKIVNKPRNDINKDDVTTTGEAGKVVRVSADGKIHATIEGSASQIAGITVNTEGMEEGQVLTMQDGELSPADNNVFTEDDVTTTGEVGKLLRVADTGYTNTSITGSAAALDGVEAELADIEDGNVLVYHASSGKLLPEAKNTTGEGKYLIIRDTGNVLGEYNGSSTVDLDFGLIIKRTSDAVVSHLSRLVGNLYLALEVANMSPTGYDGMIVESFDGDCEELDETSVIVTSIVSGDDSIDVDSVEGLMKGSYYQLADGNNTEEVQVKEINISKGINRVILASPVQHQFDPGSTMLYRSSVMVYNGKIYGGDNKTHTTWNPTTVWQGNHGAVQTTVMVASSLEQSSEFVLSGDTTFTSDGYMTLDTTIEHAHGSILTLVRTGGGKGTWTVTDEKGSAF